MRREAGRDVISVAFIRLLSLFVEKVSVIVRKWSEGLGTWFMERNQSRVDEIRCSLMEPAAFVGIGHIFIESVTC